MTLTQGHGCGINYQKFACLRNKERTTHRITTKHGSFIALVMVITLFGVVLMETFILASFFFNSVVFFQGQTIFCPYLGNGWSDWCETKRKCIGWMLGAICDLDLWPHSWSWPWPWPFKAQFRNISISETVGLIDIKLKWSELIWYWADCMTLPFDHTHDLDPGVEFF